MPGNSIGVVDPMARGGQVQLSAQQTHYLEQLSPLLCALMEVEAIGEQRVSVILDTPLYAQFPTMVRLTLGSNVLEAYLTRIGTNAEPKHRITRFLFTGRGGSLSRNAERAPEFFAQHELNPEISACLIDEAELERAAL